MSDNITDFHFFVENMLENLSSRQVHLLPMTSFISSGTNVLIDIYFKLEELNDNWERIKDMIKVNKNLIKTNTSKKIKNKEEWLTPKIKDKIYQIYKTDFINFEYEK